jgi:hypothetical protein
VDQAVREFSFCGRDGNSDGRRKCTYLRPVPSQIAGCPRPGPDEAEAPASDKALDRRGSGPDLAVLVDF